MADVRDAFLAPVEALCGGSPRAQDVTDAFGIHRKLGWQIWNVAFAEDPLLAIRYVPSPRSIRAWHAAAAERGLPGELLARMLAASDAFEQLVLRHAQDRRMFEMMAEACLPEPDEANELRWRRQAFNGNSFIWGVRARTLLATLFLHPARKPGYFDMARIQGLIGMVRTRPNVRWPFAQSIVRSDDGREWRPAREPLMPSELTRRTGVPLMEAFCSQPPPAVQRREGELGLLEDELLPGEVGQTGECTVLTGELMRDVAPAYRTHPDEDALWGTGVRTPGEVLICDHFVHHALFPGVERELRVYSELITPTTRDERDLLPVSERLQALGRGTLRIRTAEVPHYAELVEHALARAGWRAEDFEVYRVRMRYPPIPVAVMVRHELPEQAA